MERAKSITYTFSKRKAEDCDALRSESSSEFGHEHLSTSFSSQTSSFSSLSIEAKPLVIDKISVYPLTKQSSKSLQQLISKSSPSELDKIICLLKSSISDLMIDLYGNYLCQTLFHTCSAEQRLFLLTAMKGSLVSIAMHSRGTHALQNLISMTNLKQEEEVYKDEFSKKVISLSKNLNASHVVQRLLSNISNPYFIIREMVGNVKELALDKYGVCVIKKCCNDPQIMNEILGDCLLLMQHPYGNYAVQAILEIWKEEISYEFVSCIQGRVAQLCLQKYASNVMEKALKVENVRTVIVKELLGESKIKEIIGNQYGCYVLRTCSLVCEFKSKAPLLASVKDAIGNIIAPKLKPLWKEIIDNLSRD